MIGRSSMCAGATALLPYFRAGERVTSRDRGDMMLLPLRSGVDVGDTGEPTARGGTFSLSVGIATFFTPGVLARRRLVGAATRLSQRTRDGCGAAVNPQRARAGRSLAGAIFGPRGQVYILLAGFFRASGRGEKISPWRPLGLFTSPRANFNNIRTVLIHDARRLTTAADDGAEVGVRGSEFRIQPRGRVRRGVGAEQLQFADEVIAVLRGIEHAVDDDEACARRQ